MKNRLLSIIFPFVNILRNYYVRWIRHSKVFQFVRWFFLYTPTETVIDTTMKYVQFQRLEGDYLEFGVYVGGTFVMAYHMAQRENLKSMRFYAFDSFEGLPKPKGIDTKGFKHFKVGEYSCSYEDFKRTISQKGVNLDKVEMIKGWYNDTLSEKTKKRLPIKKAAIVYVDCDLYEPTVPVLDFVTDYLQDGTVIIFDDWFCYRGNPKRGEHRAFTDWLKKNPSIKASEFHKFGYNGNSFIIHKS